MQNLPWQNSTTSIPSLLTVDFGLGRNKCPYSELFVRRTLADVQVAISIGHMCKESLKLEIKSRHHKK